MRTAFFEARVGGWVETRREMGQKDRMVQEIRKGGKRDATRPGRRKGVGKASIRLKEEGRGGEETKGVWVGRGGEETRAKI